MKTIRVMLLAATAALVLILTPTNTQAQEQRRERPPGGGDRGGFDPEQMRIRMMERYRESLEVKNDDEWKVIEPRIQKVSDARRASSGFGAFGRGGFGRRGGEDRGGGRSSNPFGEANPDAEALEKSIEAKASNDELKAKLAKYRESQKAKLAALTAAQDELRKVLSLRQEATAVTMGLLQ